MSNRACPKCGTKVDPLKLLVMGPAKVYRCSHCDAPISVSATSNRVLMYSGLLLVVPAYLYRLANPVLESGAILLATLILSAALTIAAQKVVLAEP